MKTISFTGSIKGVNAVRYLNLLLCLVALLILALLVREYVTRGSVLTSADRGLTTSAIHGKAKRSAFSRYALIGQSGILGAPAVLSLIHSRPVDSKGAGAEGVAVSSSGYTLLGTVVGTGAVGFAVFKEKSSGREEVIGRGQSVFSLGTLVSVSRYRAVVESGGHRQIFTMDLNEKEKAMGVGREEEEDTFTGGMGGFFRPGGRNPFTDMMGAKVSKIAKHMGGGKWLVDKRALDSAIEDSNKVLSDARFYPYREGGVVKGYLISQVRASGVFYGMGMRSGDIILRVNGYTIDAPEKAMSLIQGLKGETDVKLDILRRGQAQTFKYEIR